MSLLAFFRPKAAPTVKVLPSLYLGLLIGLGFIVHLRPSVGLAGIGVVLVLAGAQILANRRLIWDSYRRAYQRKARSVWTEPRRIYYRLNVVLVWPLVIVIGLGCIFASVIVTP